MKRVVHREAGRLSSHRCAQGGWEALFSPLYTGRHARAVHPEVHIGRHARVVHPEVHTQGGMLGRYTPGTHTGRHAREVHTWYIPTGRHAREVHPVYIQGDMLGRYTPCIYPPGRHAGYTTPCIYTPREACRVYHTLRYERCTTRSVLSLFSLRFMGNEARLIPVLLKVRR